MRNCTSSSYQSDDHTKLWPESEKIMKDKFAPGLLSGFVSDEDVSPLDSSGTCKPNRYSGLQSRTQQYDRHQGAKKGPLMSLSTTVNSPISDEVCPVETSNSRCNSWTKGSSSDPLMVPGIGTPDRKPGFAKQITLPSDDIPFDNDLLDSKLDDDDLLVSCIHFEDRRNQDQYSGDHKRPGYQTNENEDWSFGNILQNSPRQKTTITMEEDHLLLSTISDPNEKMLSIGKRKTCSALDPEVLQLQSPVAAKKSKTNEGGNPELLELTSSGVPATDKHIIQKSGRPRPSWVDEFDPEFISEYADIVEFV